MTARHSQALLLALLALAALPTLSFAQDRKSPDEPLAVIYFDTGSSELGAADRHQLAAAVTWLHEHPRRLLIVEGYADPRGAWDANLALSQRRNTAVRDELIRIGANPERLFSAAHGEAEAGRDLAEDRRVVVRGTPWPFTGTQRSGNRGDGDERSAQ